MEIVRQTIKEIGYSDSAMGFDYQTCSVISAIHAQEPVSPFDAPTVVFSSLTPHRTGPNTTSATRKAYILQFAPDGAVIHARDGSLVPANQPDRQYLIGDR